MKNTNNVCFLSVFLTLLLVSACENRPQIGSPALSKASESADVETPDRMPQDQTEEESREEQAKDTDMSAQPSAVPPAEEVPVPTPIPEKIPLALYSRLKPKIFDADCKTCHKSDVK